MVGILYILMNFLDKQGLWKYYIQYFYFTCYMSFVKHIEGSFKEGKREEAIKKIVDFYNGLSGKIDGFNGFIMSGSLDDPQKAVNISLWETREDMDDYYSNNKEYPSFLESLKPLIEQVTDNKDYRVFGFNINK